MFEKTKIPKKNSQGFKTVEGGTLTTPMPHFVCQLRGYLITPYDM